MYEITWTTAEGHEQLQYAHSLATVVDLLQQIVELNGLLEEVAHVG